MRLSFTDHEEWLDELREVCEGDPEGRPSLARLAIENLPTKDDKGMNYNDVILCASFMYDMIMYEMLLNCGEQYVDINMGDGKANADRIASEIKEGCKELSVKVRPGRLDLGL